MESLKLNEEQKEKLLEMTKALFPEYQLVEVSDGSCDYCLEGTIKLSTFSHPSHNNWILFHWIEFSLRYLTIRIDRLYLKKKMDPLNPYSEENRRKKLNYPKNWKDLWELRPFFGFNDNMNGEWPKQHPVDYLYKLFLSLKD